MPGFRPFTLPHPGRPVVRATNATSVRPVMVGRASYAGWGDPLADGAISGSGKPVDFMQGESRKTGKVWHVRGWHSWSDRRKLRFCRDLAERYGRDPKMRQFVIQRVIAGVPDRDYKGQAAAILSYVQTSIRYVNEPGEQLQSPWATMRLGYGDCDDEAVLVAAMCESIALPWRFVLGGSNGRRPVRWAEGTRQPWGVKWSHIYLDIGDQPFKPRQWIPAEPTMNVPLGYDVTMQGLPGAQGGRLPELAGVGFHGVRMGAAPTLVYGRRLGSTGALTPLDVTEKVNQAVVTDDRPFWRQLSYHSIAARAIEGAVAALLIRQAMKYVR